MLRRAFAILLLGAMGLLLTAPPSPAEDFVTTPRTNKGAKWRIGYLEGGPYFNYRRNLEAMVYGLMRLGWIEPAMLPDSNGGALADTADLWGFLCANMHSEFLEFVPDARYSAGWNERGRAIIRQRIIDRLNNDQDIDLMIAAGTWAGQDLATDEHHCPVLVFSVSDPVASGIVKSPAEPLHAHVHAKCDPDRYLRMVRLFYTLFRFQTLGVTYEDTEEGRIYAALPDFEKAAQELGFELARCTAPMTGISEQEAVDGVVACQEELSRTADAVMIPVHRGVQPAAMERIMSPLLQRKIPTMTQQSSLEVAHGVLLGMTLGRGAFREVGMFHAKAAASIFNGISPGDLPMVFEDPRLISINLETARIIGWPVPPSLLEVADEVYTTIERSVDQLPGDEQ